MTPIGRLISVGAFLGVMAAVCLIGALPIVGLFTWPVLVLALVLSLPLLLVILRPKSK